MKRKEHKQELVIDFQKLPVSLKLMFHCIDNAEKIEFFDHKIVVKIDEDMLMNALQEHYGHKVGVGFSVG